jgi:hypothetical protein
LAESFSQITSDCLREDRQVAFEALRKLRAILIVFNTHKSKFDIEDIRDHLKRIAELLLSSSLIQQFQKLLLVRQDQEMYQLHIEILGIISILSGGVKAFS